MCHNFMTFKVSIFLRTYKGKMEYFLRENIKSAKDVTYL